MRIASILQERIGIKKQRTSGENTVTEVNFENRKAESVISEMTLHIPCYVAGRTASGSRWKGKTKTVSLNSCGARLLIPEHIDLEGEFSILFRIPSALKVLFSKVAFRVKAGINRSDVDGHWLAPSGQKVVCIVFNHPVRFASWAAQEWRR